MYNFNTVNIVALAIFAACLIIYSYKLKTALKKPEESKRGMLNFFYGLWVKRMIDTEETIVAVQTMRNIIMSTTFLSSAMLVVLGLLVKFPSTGINEIIDITPFSSAAVAQYKFLLLFGSIVFSLIMFLLSLRHMVRFTILIGIPIREIETSATKKIESNSDTDEENRLDARAVRTDVFLTAMNRFTYGLRGVYYSIVILFWFFSVYAFIAATLIMTTFMIKLLDVKTPCVEETPI
ncbi:MAG: DUF599 domain-containing protein [Candidatus Thermoplasmatota archaeon]